MAEKDILKEAALLVKDELRGAKVLKVKQLLEEQKKIREKIQKVLGATTIEQVRGVY